MSEFDLVILRPERKIFESKASEIILPGKEGQFTVLANHAPILALLGKGKIIVKKASTKKEFDIEGGFAQASQNKVNILVK